MAVPCPVFFSGTLGSRSAGSSTWKSGRLPGGKWELESGGLPVGRGSSSLADFRSEVENRRDHRDHGGGNTRPAFAKGSLRALGPEGVPFVAGVVTAKLQDSLRAGNLTAHLRAVEAVLSNESYPALNDTATDG